ncbi:protein trichome birefringence-like 3 isoform X1 [Telopea speciosissima]|uniref:protein trichome birefringence-like 3 isoform X1 n=1 Tax=Telopea speciosissima TaxID=54955 RepID=UPI001CC4EEB6|nr:protein trichome birefringence-like 3 isoform X1 [Telopea speciosissima]
MQVDKMKPLRSKLPLSIVAVGVCAFAFIAVLYIEDAGYLKFMAKSCSKQEPISHSHGSKSGEKNVSSSVEEDLLEDVDGDKEEFDPNNCRIFKGKWVFNTSIEPLYSDTTCPYLDRQVSCVKNGRPDSDYRYWEWQPDDCILPRFDPIGALEKLRGKRLMFVGDSLQRGQWQSFVCMVESSIPPDQKSMHRGRSHSVFKAKEYNASIEFYWAPFLVESNSDRPIKADPNDRILRVDSVFKHAKYWVGVDILVFNSYVWWMSGLKIKSLWGSFANGEDGFEELDAPVAYRIALKTWANWVDSTIDPNKTRLFFTTMSPTHMRSADWHNKKGIRCYNETQPVMEKRFWGSGADRRIMDVVAGIAERMTVPVSFINITQLSDYRKDGHTSVYTETGGELLTDEQKADPLTFADCIHWCLPGVPDTWNRMFYAYL